MADENSCKVEVPEIQRGNSGIEDFFNFLRRV